MLPKGARIRKKKEFDNVFNNGSAKRSGFLVVRSVKNSLDMSRFGFIISHKVSKRAVVRNKIRRRLSALCSSNLKNIKSGFDIVFIVQSGMETKDFTEISEIFYSVFSKSGLIQG